MSILQFSVTVTIVDGPDLPRAHAERKITTYAKRSQSYGGVASTIN